LQDLRATKDRRGTLIQNLENLGAKELIELACEHSLNAKTRARLVRRGDDLIDKSGTGEVNLDDATFWKLYNAIGQISGERDLP